MLKNNNNNNNFCLYSNMFSVPWRERHDTKALRCWVCPLPGTRMLHQAGAAPVPAACARLSLSCWGLNCHRVDVLPTCTFPETKSKSRRGESLELLSGVKLRGEFETLIGPRIRANSSSLLFVFS